MTAASQPPAQSLGSTNVVFNKEIHFDQSYVKAYPGWIKMTLIGLNFLGLICIQTSAFASNSRGVFFSIVAGLGLVVSSGLLLLYLFHVVEKYHRVRWLLVELVSSAVVMFLYFIASTIAVAFGSIAYSAAGFFGYLAMTLYAAEAVLKGREAAAGGEAQAARRVVVPPAAQP